MGDLGGADAEGISAERAMGRSVAVAAHDQQAGQREALLGPDHVHDALAGIVEPEQRYAVLGGVFLERRTMRAISGLAITRREPRVGT